MAGNDLSTTFLSQVTTIVQAGSANLDKEGVLDLLDRAGTRMLDFAAQIRAIETGKAPLPAPVSAPTQQAATSVAALNSGNVPGKVAVGGETFEEIEEVDDEASPAPAAEAAAEETPEFPRQRPAVPIEDTVHDDYIISLEDGKKYKVLTRHLRALGMTPEQYRRKWGLSLGYPMAAPNFSKKRQQIAKDMGFGKFPRAAGSKRKGSDNAAADNPAPRIAEAVGDATDTVLAGQMAEQGQPVEVTSAPQSEPLPLEQAIANAEAADRALIDQQRAEDAAAFDAAATAGQDQGETVTEQTEESPEAAEARAAQDAAEGSQEVPEAAPAPEAAPVQAEAPKAAPKKRPAKAAAPKADAKKTAAPKAETKKASAPKAAASKKTTAPKADNKKAA